MPSSFRSLAPLALGAFLGLAAGCASQERSPGRRNQVSSLVRYGHYQEARDLALELFELDPEDPAARRDLIDAEVALLLDKGIDQVFLDRVEAGLRLFYRAEELDPKNAEVQLWVRKANIQIAEDSLTLAARINEKSRPDEKVAALQRVLAHLPVDVASERVQSLRAKAVRGLISVQMYQAYERGGTYSTYQEGIRDLNRSLVTNGVGEESRSGIANTLEVQVSGVKRRFIQASRYEQDELLLAARFEYEMVLSLEAEHQGAKEGLLRIAPQLQGLELGQLSRREPALPESQPEELEAQAAAPASEAVEPDRVAEPAVEPESLSHPESEIELESAPEPVPVPALEPEIETASESLTESEAEEPRQSREDKLKQLYLEAIALEDQGLLPEAVEVYDQIRRTSADYKDVEARRETMAEFITHADELYTQAMDADSNSTSLILLKRIAAFWPNYRDVKEQIRNREADEPASDDGHDDPS